MIAKSGIKITGLEAVQKAMKTLEPKLAKQVIRKAQRDALKIAQAAAKDDAPVLTGAGRRSIRVRTSKGPRGSKSKHTISLALLVGRAKGKEWYMGLQEHGWTTGKRIKQGKTVVGRIGDSTKIEGRHFMRRALRSSEDAMKALMTERILEGIERLTQGPVR